MHVVVPGKQHHVGVDVEAHNNYEEMHLFSHFCRKISVEERNLPKNLMPWEQKGGKAKVVTAGPS